ncbi:MAG TPA: carboxypeptidase M32, partial [bacterium]|nr:carboxypeptidase M32 [bacterium]
MKTEIRTLVDRWAEIEDISKASQVLEWDQETKMPGGGAEVRGIQLATLAELAHENLVSRDFKHALKGAATTTRLPTRDAAIVREARREHDRAARVPGSLVEEIARAESVGLEMWRKARRTNRWNEFSRQLVTLVRLKRRLADAVGYRDQPYDALLDMYEPDATVAQLDPLFEGLKEVTIPLVQKIARARRRPDRRILTRKYPQEGQLRFVRMVLDAMGFDFDAGRLDLSTHPFCSGFAVGDVRLTTRVNERDLRPCTFGSIHEAGHGLYEQGFDPRLSRTPLGHAISLGVHESQSRLWENIVGRSRPFWAHFLPRLKRVFPEQLKGVKLADFHFAVNEVTPSFIRVEADEVTYNLHIVLRYELEKGLFDGSIRPEKLPQEWNARMKSLLGITPGNDSEGVLQDIHWAMGLYGYFPTYSLGNLYSAQIWKRARRDLPDLEDRIRKGDLVTLRDWL